MSRFIPIAFCAGFASVYAIRSLFKNLVPQGARVNARSVVDDIDDSEYTLDSYLSLDNDDKEESNPPPYTPRNRMKRIRKIAALASLHCRTKFGFKSRTEANELVARKFMHDYVTSLSDMRLADVPLVMPYALELCFVPSRAELDAKMMMQTSIIRDRQAALHRNFWDWSFGWFNDQPETLCL